MVTAIADRPQRGVSAVSLSLGVLQIFISLGGLGGGGGLVADPSGGYLGMSTDALANSPFRDYLVPGLFLLVVNGIGHMVAGVFSLRRTPSFSGLATGLGLVLMLWITCQVYWIGLTSWLQPLYFTLGLLELSLGLAAGHSDRLDKHSSQGAR